MEKIVILDYANCTVHFGKIPEDISPEEYMKSHNFNKDDCYFMTGEHFNIEVE